MSQRESLMVESLWNALPRGAIDLELSDRRFDAVAVLPDGSRQALEFKWVGEGYPRDVNRVLRVGPYVEPDSLAASAQTIVFARRFSKNAIDLLRDRGLSWVALDGSASVQLGTVWVERDARFEPPPAVEGPFAWTTARSEIAEALLAAVARSMVPVDERPAVPLLEDLARWSARSLGAVAKTLSEFDREGWTTASRPSRRRVLTNGPALLDSWSSWYAEHHFAWNMYHSLHREPGRVEETLQSALGTDVVFTGLTASQLLVPTMTSAPVVSAYVIGGREGWRAVDRALERHDVQPAGSGQIRLALCPPVVESFASDLVGVRTAAPVRVYADLLSGFSRELEAAEAYRAITLGSLA